MGLSLAAASPPDGQGSPYSGRDAWAAFPGAGNAGRAAVENRGSNGLELAAGDAVGFGSNSVRPEVPPFAVVATYRQEHYLRRYSRRVAVTLERLDHARAPAEDHNANPCEPRRCCRPRQGADRWRKPELRPRALSTIFTPR